MATGGPSSQQDQPGERWVLTRKTWRGMIERYPHLLEDIQTWDLKSIEEKFQDYCRIESECSLAASASPPRSAHGELLHSESYVPSSSWMSEPSSCTLTEQEEEFEDDGKKYDSGGQYKLFGEDGGFEEQSRRRKSRSIQLHTHDMSVQTDYPLVEESQTTIEIYSPTTTAALTTQAPTCDIRSATTLTSSSPKEALPTASAYANSATASPLASTPHAIAPTPAFSSSIFKYFGLGRKKKKEDIDRFKTINYDRNLRDIKSKRDFTIDKDYVSDDMTSMGIQVGEPHVVSFAKGSAANAPLGIGASTGSKMQFPISKTTSLVLASETQFCLPQRSSSQHSAIVALSDELDVTAEDSAPSSTACSTRRNSAETESSPNSGSLSVPVSPSYESREGRSKFQNQYLKVCNARSESSKRSRRSLPALHSSLISGATSSPFSTSPKIVRSTSTSGPTPTLSPITTHATGSSLSDTSCTSSFSASKLNSFLSVIQKTRSASASVSPVEMKEGSHSSRILAKRMWKTRSKSQSRASASSTCIWTPRGQCRWTSITGREVTLAPTTLLHLTEVERLTLQTVALAKLQALNLGVPIRIPSESVTSAHKPKRRAHLLRKRALSSGGFHSKKELAKDASGTSRGLVFGIPLSECVANERIAKKETQRSTPEPSSTTPTVISNAEETGGLSRKPSHGSRTSFGSLIEGLKPDKGGGSCESLNLDRKRSLAGSAGVLDTLTSSDDALLAESLVSPLVPGVVTQCFRHLEEHGLDTLGIFRVSSSKKRVRQLREDFDEGKDIQLNEDCSPHDLATLLKEYFRDLPDSLLTRDLYAAFVRTQKVRNRRLQLEALQHLVQMLPPANRDTLKALLSFLASVAEKAIDHVSKTGEFVSGNKMDSNNLATLFAPNILHSHSVKDGSSAKLATDSAAHAEERLDVINVVRSMIDHHKEMFEVPAELLDEVYIHMMDTHPDVLDKLLRRRCSQPDDSAEDVIDLDTSGSVFEGSECSSIPRTPTQEESETNQRPEEPAAPTSRRYRKREEILHENGGTGGRDYRDRRREEKYVERSRQKREASRSRQEVTDLPRTGSFPSTQTGKPNLSREKSEPSMERKRGIVGVVVQPVRTDRRLSSPCLDNIITASLTIPVNTAPTSNNKPALVKSFTVDDENDIPYIEDTSSSQDDSSRSQKRRSSVVTSNIGSAAPSTTCPSPSRPRSGSSDSYLTQPLTGSVTVMTSRGSHDSVLSGGSVTSTISRPPELPCSGTSSPLSLYGYTSPPASPLYPTEERSVYWPSNNDKYLSSRSKEKLWRPLSVEKENVQSTTTVQIAIQKSGSTSDASKVKVSQYEIEKKTTTATTMRDATASSVVGGLMVGKGKPAGVTVGVVRSKTDDLERLFSSTDHGKHQEKKKKYTGSRNQTVQLPGPAQRKVSVDRQTSDSGVTSRHHKLEEPKPNKMSALRKRWEIIASEQPGPETFV